MNSYKAPGQIKLHPGEMLPAYFNHKACTTFKKNDNILPYGTTIVSAVPYIYHSNKTDVTSEWLAQDLILTKNMITLILQYPATSLNGLYDIKFELTLSDNSIKYAYFDKLFAVS